MLPKKAPVPPPAGSIFDALGNAVRRQILAELGTAPLNVVELAERFAISRPAISRHLAVLEAAGLVRHETSGTRNYYRLDSAGFMQSREWLDRFWDDAEGRLRLVAENLPLRGSDE